MVGRALHDKYGEVVRISPGDLSFTGARKSAFPPTQGRVANTNCRGLERFACDLAIICRLRDYANPNAIDIYGYRVGMNI